MSFLYYNQMLIYVYYEVSFYAFVTCAYITGAKMGLGLPYEVSLIIGGIFAVAICVITIFFGGIKDRKNAIDTES